MKNKMKVIGLIVAVAILLVACQSDVAEGASHNLTVSGCIGCHRNDINKPIQSDTPKIITKCVNGYMYAIATSNDGISITQMYQEGYTGNNTRTASARPIKCN